MQKVVGIFIVENIGAATVENKNTFRYLLIQEFPSNSYNKITDEKKSMELSNLAQKEDENLYIYYQHSKNILNGIHRRDQITNSGRDTITLNSAK